MPGHWHEAISIAVRADQHCSHMIHKRVQWSQSFLTKRGSRQVSTSNKPRSVPVLPDATLETFRRQAWDTSQPALLPSAHFKGKLPAIEKWFTGSPASQALGLNAKYWSLFGSTIVPLELTNTEKDTFVRIEHSLSFFLEAANAHASRYLPANNSFFTTRAPRGRAVKHFQSSYNTTQSEAPVYKRPTVQVYLAQAPIQNLPAAVRADVPTPDIVLGAGKGDLYGSSIWLGIAPTYTPLHRDPNPNMLVQLAGKKIVRLYHPEIGRAIFAKVQEEIGARGSATIRGEEMMQGLEKKALESEVWNATGSTLRHCWEAELNVGDGLFIPKGWWHSVRGAGTGMTGSVSLAHRRLSRSMAADSLLGQLVVSVDQP